MGHRCIAGSHHVPSRDPALCFSVEQRFFISWAQGWRTAYRDDALRRQVMVGPYSPGQFRTVGALVNQPEFFEAFDIKEGDLMWRPPAERVKIW